MLEHPSDIAFSEAVKAIQSAKGSRAMYARMEAGEGWQTKITPDLNDFIASLDMFYLATANAEGQPYIQHRGGPKGFLRVLDEHTLAFADFRGNKQYITVGNLTENPKAFIFLMDYMSQTRVKLWGKARVVEGDKSLMAKLIDPAYKGVPERAIVFELSAWDANCRQHIHRRFPEEDVLPVIEEMKDRIRSLESEITQLRAGTSENKRSI